MVLREGSGTIKHLEIKELWVQEAIRDHKILVNKIPREQNIVDLLCSVPHKQVFEAMLTEMNITFPSCPGQEGEFETAAGDGHDNEGAVIETHWATRSRATLRRGCRA